MVVFFVRRFGRNSASLEKFRSSLALVQPNSEAGIKLRAFDCFKRILAKKNYCVAGPKKIIPMKNQLMMKLSVVVNTLLGLEIEK
jgi:hypothetical protein